jgi:hypothetical protein
MKSLEGRIGLGIAAFTLAVTGAACTVTDKTDYPSCSDDPTLKQGSFTLKTTDYVVWVDDVKFWRTESQLFMDATRPSSIKKVNGNDNHLNIDGAENGRIYDVKVTKDSLRRTLHVKAECPSK